MMITEKEAWRHIVEAAEPLESEEVELCDAPGRILVEPILADRDLPPNDRSAMDGYAVRAEDIADVPSVLQINGEIAAGAFDFPAVSKGSCVRIFTGAVIPPGADTVVMQEDTTANENTVTILKSGTCGENIFRRGENAHAGDVLVPAGIPLNAVRIGLCSSAGKAKLRVYRKPTVAILVTGDEIVSAAAEVADHQTRDSNGPMMQALLEESGFECSPPQAVLDTPEAVPKAIKSALATHEIVLLSGGVSVGNYDLVPASIKQVGGFIVYHGVKIKPGKPQLFAIMPSGKHVFGLPGNPLSVMTGMREFALPFMRMRSGSLPQYARPLLRLPLAEDARSGGKRQQYVAAQFILRDGITQLLPLYGKGSADLAAAATADGVIIVPEGIKRIAAGSVVDFRPWGYTV